MPKTPDNTTLFGALSALEWQALVVAAKAAGKFRPALVVAPDQAVDVTIRVRAAMTVCGDQVCQVTVKPALADVLGVALLQLGPLTRQKVSDAIAREFDPAALGERPYEPRPEAVEMVENLLLRVSSKKAQSRSGNATGDVRVDLIGRALKAEA